MDREKLVDNLLTFVPMMYKKLMKDIIRPGIPKQQMWLLFLLDNHNEKPMSYYSEKMMIPKPNLTSLVDKLIEDKLVERIFDPNDRRVILLKITEKGREFIEEYKKNTKKIILDKIEIFDESDVKKLNDMFEEMKKLFDKIQ